MAAINAAVDDAGFELLWLELQLRGTLHSSSRENDDGRLTLMVTGTAQKFLVDSGVTDAERDAYAQLSPWIDQPERLILLRGRANAHPGTLPAITVLDARLL